MDLDVLLRLSQTILLPVLGYGAYVLRSIRDELRKTNGRLTTIEAWRLLHDKQDDERHRDLVEEVKHLKYKQY